MAILAQTSILPEFIKLRWMEPYVSGGLNRTNFKTLPRGVYNGFVIKAGPGNREITIAHDDPSGWDSAGVSGYVGGAFDTASGWSVAIHSSAQGFNTAVVIQSAPGRNYTFDLSSYGGQSVFAAIDVQYQIGASTEAQIKIVQAADLDISPTLICLGRIDVPVLGALTDSNIVYDDPAYPRVLPYANRYKPGFMSRKQAMDIDWLGSVSGSPALTYEYVVLVDGPQTIELPPDHHYVIGGEDLWVFKNGVYKTAGANRDYIEVDRGDGRGEEIQWVGLDLKEGDRIKFRIQEYAAHETSTLRVFDENVLIDPNVVRMRFTGVGVQVTPDGPRQVRVSISGGGGGGGGAIKTKQNTTGATLLQFRAVRVIDDNTMGYFDPADPTHVFYGITIQDVVNLAFGEVQTTGIVTGGGIGLGTIGSELFIQPGGGGEIGPTPPDPLLYQVVKVGILDGPDGVSTSTPEDIVIERGRVT